MKVICENCGAEGEVGGRCQNPSCRERLTAYVPSPEEIESACRSIQAGWTDKQRDERWRGERRISKGVASAIRSACWSKGKKERRRANRAIQRKRKAAAQGIKKSVRDPKTGRFIASGDCGRQSAEIQAVGAGDQGGGS